MADIIENQVDSSEVVTIEDVPENQDTEDNNDKESYEMKGPSLFDKPNIQQPQIDPEMLAKLQQNPAFLNMVKQQEANIRYQNMTPREKLRARLKQKQYGRMNGKVKEVMESEEARKIRKKKANVPSNSE